MRAEAIIGSFKKVLYHQGGVEGFARWLLAWL